MMSVKFWPQQIRNPELSHTRSPGHAIHDSLPLETRSLLSQIWLQFDVQGNGCIKYYLQKCSNKKLQKSNGTKTATLFLIKLSCQWILVFDGNPLVFGVMVWFVEFYLKNSTGKCYSNPTRTQKRHVWMDSWLWQMCGERHWPTNGFPVSSF